MSIDGFEERGGEWGAEEEVAQGAPPLPEENFLEDFKNYYDKAWLSKPRPPRFRPVVVEVSPRATFRIFYFDGVALLVKTVVPKIKRSSKAPVTITFQHRVEYCGPLMYKSRRGDKVFVEIGGRVQAVATTVDELYNYLQHVGLTISRCEDPDAISGEVAGKIPTKQVLQSIVASLPWRVEWDEVIDVESGVDHSGKMRVGADVERDARGWAEMQHVLKKVYGVNAAQALANAALFAASVYSYIFRRARLNTTVRNIIYNYGETRLGKSMLFNKLLQTICDNSECASALLLKVDSGVDTEAQLRALLSLHKLPLVLDEQREDKLRFSVGLLLAAATGHVAKVHAARYGHGVGATFTVERAVFVVSNSAPYRLFTLIPNPAEVDALARRLFVIRWEPEPIDEEKAAWFAEEYTPPPLFPFAAEVYKTCRGELEKAKSLVDMAKKFWQCASRRFNMDYSDYINALETVEKAQKEEKPTATTDEFDTLWALARRHIDPENRLTDIEVLTRLLSNAKYVYYANYSNNMEELYERWRRTCLYSADFAGAENPAQLLSEVADCYFGVSTLDVLPVYAQQFVQTVASMIMRGVWPYLKGRTDIVGMPKRVLGAERSTRRVGGNVLYVFDVFDKIIKRIIGESKEDLGDVDNSQEHGGNTSTPPNTPENGPIVKIGDSESSPQSLNTPIQGDVEHTENSIPSTPGVSRGVGVSPPYSLQTPKLEETEVKEVDNYEECIRQRYEHYVAKGLSHEKALYEAMRECL